MTHRLVLGIDPDTKCSGAALVSGSPEMPFLVGLWSIKNANVAKGYAAVIEQAQAALWFSLERQWPEQTELVIEGQKAYGKTDKTDPNALLRLACITGSFATAFASHRTRVVLPQEWKKQVPKQINQARTCSKLGLPFRTVGKDQRKGYVVPDRGAWETNITKDSDYKHVMDAAGIALWGLLKSTPA